MKLLIKNATVIDGIGDKPLLAYNVTVEGNRITGLDARALPAERFGKVIDASGRTLIPGIINSHVHLVLKGDCGERARDEMAGQDAATQLPCPPPASRKGRIVVPHPLRNERHVRRPKEPRAGRPQPCKRQ